MIRKLSISSIATAMLCSSVAFAADLPSRLPPPPAPYVPMFSWTGLYVGANIGYGGDRFAYPFNGFAPPFVFSGSPTITSGGVLGGGQLGYNWEFPNNILLGFETDFDGAAIRGKATADAGAVILGLPVGAAASAGSRINYIGTVRGRVGYAFDRFLVYGTGGFAYGQVNFTANAAAVAGGVAAAISTSQNSNRTGWTAGGGVEYAITNNLTLKTEYLYVNLGTNTLLNAGGINIRQKTTANIVRAGLNYKFDWFAPPPAVVAKY
ncbi:porin family protein [Beijerinckiaceae bacterium]|nr:porin family protein [Beijerinckiaceae bacterium]